MISFVILHATHVSSNSVREFPEGQYHRPLLERILLVLLSKRLYGALVARLCLDVWEEGALEQRVVEHASPARRPPVDALAKLVELRLLGAPQAAADEGLLRLAVDVVARIRALAAGAGPGG